MKHLKSIMSVALLSIFLCGCSDFLDTDIETRYQEDEVFVNYERMSKAGYGVYTFLFSQFGFNRINNAMLASACDEADHADINSTIHRFNKGTWNATSNPEDAWNNLYVTIRRANLFLEKSTDYKTILDQGGNVIPANKEKYDYNVRDIEWLRAEVRFLRAYCHFELIKRYGGVPIMTQSTDDETILVNKERDSFEACITFIENECTELFPLLKDTWVGFDDNKWRGRATKVAAQALKTRTLLYAASPLNNPTNDLSKWIKAVNAAEVIIASGVYSLHNDYAGLFRLGNGSDGNFEVLFAVQRWNENSFEKNNFPIGYDQGGQSSTSPSQNLVDAYEMKASGLAINKPGSGYDPANPYAGRDPRLGMSILVNNVTFKGRPVECWVGGIDGLGKTRATTTGYYIKKYINDGLDLAQNQTSVHSWILFRYAEVLLSYAEAMNEAYGPETKSGHIMTAKAAIDAVRQRDGIKMPNLTPGVTQDEMRNKIRNERRVELAFEEHRFFDVRRWKIAAQTENEPLMAMKITKTNNTFNYLVVKKEERIFKSHMYLYPIPEAETLKGSVDQNPGW